MISLLFSLVIVVIFGMLLLKRFRWWNRDRRQYRRQTQRELIEAILLFLVAFGAAVSSGAYYADPAGSFAGLLLKVGIGLSWGAIIATGIWMLTEPNPAPRR